MTYPYSARHPAANPAHYMYAPFGGIEFLTAYARDRRSLLRSLPQGDGAPPGARTLPSFPCEIDTAGIALACAVAESASPGSAAPFAAFFLVKVEVARQLRRSYGLNGRPASTEEADIAAYPCVAMLFAARVSLAMPDRLRWLNGLLKVNDILSHRRDELCADPAAWMARSPLQAELRAVQDLAAAQGIEGNVDAP